MPVSSPSRRSGPRPSALVVAGLAAAVTLGGAVGLGGPAPVAPAPAAATIVVTLPADPTPPARTVVTTVYEVTPTAVPVAPVVVHRVVAGGGDESDHENEQEGDD